MPQFLDTLQNLVTNLGRYSKDKAASSEFGTLAITDAELTAIHESGGIGGKVIDCVADDLTRKWRTVTIPDEDSKPFYDLEAALNAQQVIGDLVRWSRLYGGAVVVVEIDGDDPAQELIESTLSPVKPITRLRALGRHELSSANRDRKTGRPASYLVSGTGETFHPSRVLGPLDGIPRTITGLYSAGGFGESILKRCYHSLVAEATAAMGISHVLHEMKQDVISIKNLSAHLDGGALQTAFERRWALASQLKSLVNAILIDADTETFVTRDSSAALSGAAPLLERFANRIAAETDIPMTRLFGQLASGLSTSGATNQQDYYDMLTAFRITRLQSVLSRLDTLLCLSVFGRVPDGFEVTWPPFRELSETEQADKDYKDSQTAEVYLRNGIIVPAHVARDIADQGPYVLSAEYVEYLEERDGIAGGHTPEPEEETEPTEGPDVSASTVTTGAEVQKTALNGAQVTSLLEIAAKAKNGELEYEQAIGIILVAFPTVTEVEARRIVQVSEILAPAPESVSKPAPPAVVPASPPAGPKNNGPEEA